MWAAAGCAGLLALGGIAALRRRRRRGRGVALPPEAREFLDRLREELAAHGPQVELRGLVPGRFAAVLAVRGQEVPVPLHGACARYEAYPEALREIVRGLVQEVESEALERPDDHSFADAAAQVLPQIRTRAWLERQGARFGDGAIVHRPFGDDLAICYVIDDPWCMVFVCRAHLRLWGRTEEDLFHLATRNLHRLAGVEVPAPEDPEPVVVRVGDGYDATRVLLLDPERVEGMLVAIPERDTLWLGRAADDLAELMARNQRHSRAAVHPVSPHVYRVRRGRLTRVESEA